MTLTVETLTSGLKIVGPQPLAGTGGEVLSDNFVLLDNLLVSTSGIIGTVENNTSGTIVLVSANSNTLYSNTDSIAETIYELPVPSSNLGLIYMFVVDGTHDITLVSDATSSIQVSSATSIDGGDVKSSTGGSVLKVISYKDDQWVATLLMGTWNVETS